MDQTNIVAIIVQYIVPIAALLLSGASFLNTRKINALEEKLKKYELERVEKEREAEVNTRVEARVVRETEKRYKIHIWNSGKERAFNIDYNLDADNPFIPQKNVTPFEYLDPGSSFEEPIVVLYGGKYKVTTYWEDKDGNKLSEEKIRTV